MAHSILRKAALTAACILLIALLCSCGGKEAPAAQEPASVETEVPVFEPDPSLDYYADIAIRDYGTVTVLLDPDAAPITVANFVTLARSGFYEGLTFHRIMAGFMMQGGAPAEGGSAASIKGEFKENGVDNPISHKAGVISMARANDPDSGSSQFFIVHKDSTFLDGKYAGFGQVTEGMDVVDKICTSAQPTDNNGSIAPDQRPVIDSITIREVPAA